MMYHMTELPPTLNCTGQSKQEVRSRNRFLNELLRLLTLMSEVNIVTKDILSKAFKASQIAFPFRVKNRRQGVAVNQHDAAELMYELLMSCNRRLGLVSNTIVTTTLRSETPIRLLMCGKKPVPAAVTTAFETEWNNRPKGERGLLKDYTLRSQRITNRTTNECAIERGVAENTDFDPSRINWDAVAGTAKTETETEPMITLKYTSPAGEVCQVIEDYIRTPHIEYDGYTKDSANDLFYFYGRRQVVIEDPTSKYLLVNFTYDPRLLTARSQFTYEKQNLRFADTEYELVCVGHHSGTQDSGHYYASVKIGMTWYRYDDINGIRRSQTISESDPPTLLLFIKKPNDPPLTLELDEPRSRPPSPQFSPPASPLAPSSPFAGPFEPSESLEEDSFDPLPTGTETPSDEVLQFFRKSALKDNDKWRNMLPPLQLVCVLPKVECLWDWIPQRADLTMSQYVFVLMEKIGTKEQTTVVWQKFQEQATVMQNLCRLIAEAFDEGPTIYSAFLSDDLKFEGFRTKVSRPPNILGEARKITIKEGSLEMTLDATTFLKQDGKRLPFKFNTKSMSPPSDKTFGSLSGDKDVWKAKPVEADSRCKNVGQVVWNTYLLNVDSKNCELTNKALFQLLNMSFRNASEAQKTTVLQSVNEIKDEDCDLPRILLNAPPNFNTYRFDFIACGKFGCSVLWQYKERGVIRPDVFKRMVLHTSKYTTTNSSKLWMMTPQREFDMLFAFHQVGAGVAPGNPPIKTDESREIMLIKHQAVYYPPVGEQFWTFSMEAGRLTLQEYIRCGLLADNIMGDMRDQVVALFLALVKGKLTHGDIHLANIMIMPNEEKLQLRLIDFGYGSNSVFMPWYDLGCFTYSCYTNDATNKEKAHTLGKQVYDELIKRKEYKKRGDMDVDALLQKANPKYRTRAYVVPAPPEIWTKAEKTALFRNVYYNEVVDQQLLLDGSTWLRTLGITMSDNGLSAFVKRLDKKRMAYFQRKLEDRWLAFEGP